MCSVKNIDGKEILFTKATPIEKSTYPGFKEESYILKKGSINGEGVMPLPCDIQVYRDTPIPLRDGTIIRADIFLPLDARDCPVITWWAPYGKRGAQLNFDAFGSKERMDVLRKWEDGLHAFEAPLPAYWVANGYAVVNPDPRGVFSSEGDINLWGTSDAKDCYDVIEWLGTQPWSNGKVALSGNSWLAISQYFVAAENPPHLAAIAPWEGLSDVYRESIAVGGIPYIAFCQAIVSGLFGNNEIEDVPSMIRQYPLFNEYWQDKKAKLEDIKVPAYIVASWVNILHTRGTFAAWEKISSADKWLRVHDEFEWPDYLRPSHMDDLRRFFDHYLKGMDNDWEKTPKVRLTILDPGNRDIINRVENEFPLTRQEIRSFYLSRVGNDLKLVSEPQKETLEISYDSESGESVIFATTFDESTELTGYFNLKLYVEARGNDDMDIFAYVRKRDVNGEVQQSHVVTGRPHLGPNGRLRVSLRKLDAAQSTELQPQYTFDTVEKLSAGEIVPVEIEIWPYGIRWSACETLELVISGQDPVKRPDFPQLPGAPTLNKGVHVIHFGGQYDSRLIVPFIPLR